MLTLAEHTSAVEHCEANFPSVTQRLVNDVLKYVVYENKDTDIISEFLASTLVAVGYLLNTCIVCKASMFNANTLKCYFWYSSFAISSY